MLKRLKQVLGNLWHLPCMNVRLEEIRQRQIGLASTMSRLEKIFEEFVDGKADMVWLKALMDFEVIDRRLRKLEEQK